VELALLLPLLMVIISGMLNVGDALRERVLLQEAVQDGANYAAQNPADPTGTRTRVREASCGSSNSSTCRPALAASEVTVTCPLPTVVKVQVVHNHTWLTGLVPMPALTMTVQAQSDVLSITTCVSG
jgi:Flp pilus assembly protein TadG